MNVYEFQISDEKEWICANTIFEALKFYHSLNDLDIIDFETTDDIVIVPPEELKNMWILDTENNMERVETFEEYMKQAKSADIIATTAF